MKSSIVQIQAKYLSGITHLFWTIFQKKVSIDELQKQYFEHPSGVHGAGFLALNHQNEVIAFCGATVCQLKYEDQTALGLQFGDTMTLSRYRGQGLFNKLSKQLEKWAIQQRILVHFVFLNDKQFSVWLKLHKGLWMGDLLFNDNSSKIITPLKSLAQKCGIHTLQLQFFEGTENQKMMSTEWNAHPSWQIGGRSFDDNWPIEKLRLVLGDLDTF